MRIQLSVFIIEIFSISMEDYVPFVHSDGSDGKKPTISSYIEYLQQVQEAFGDLPVVFDSNISYDESLYCPFGGAAKVLARHRSPGRYDEVEDDNEDGEFVIHLGDRY